MKNASRSPGALYVLLTALFILPLFLHACSSVGARKTAEEINQNSGLPMALLTPHDEVRESLQLDEGMEYVPNFMSFDYYADNYMLSFSGFPTDKDASLLTEIRFSGNGYDIYGVKISDSPASAAQTFTDHGYSENSANVFSKDDVTIVLSGGGTITEIAISLPTSYTSGNLY